MHELSNPVFHEKIRKISSINLSAAEFAQRVVKCRRQHSKSFLFFFIFIFLKKKR